MTQKGAGKWNANAIEAYNRMAGVGLGAIGMEWIGTDCESVEALRNGPAEEMSAAPPVFHHEGLVMFEEPG
jgi:hypothetical protein